MPPLVSGCSVGQPILQRRLQDAGLSRAQNQASRMISLSDRQHETVMNASLLM